LPAVGWSDGAADVAMLEGTHGGFAQLAIRISGPFAVFDSCAFGLRPLFTRDRRD
jgi:hypothetical protein